MKPIIDAGWHHFVKVAELGSVSRAAVAADVPQSVVSRHIAQLERDAGSPLFRRTGRGVVLTELGQQLYPRIKRLIAESESFADEVRASRGVPVGDVRLGLLPSTVPALAGPLYQRVLKQFPQVRLHLMEGSSSQLQEMLDEGRLDLSLLLRDGGEVSADEPVLARAVVLAVARHRPHTLATREIQGLVLSMAPDILARGDSARDFA
jgi:DNA-binding transcriptional LysR family regulator